ncbi:C45 family peptidase [Oceanobacillus profundus]|uniref:C45 family autoproteolytic acyltransferase/hydolase n=1 Tax=Oceanobacillus TaxID=182709 RepID=UPI0026E3F02E|nr:C45 family peptidase [Oceanobacillus profundus]MDO6448590.1 C45 family peptidase [Oceanobacillus profundus]
MSRLLPNVDTVLTLSGTSYEIGFKHGSLAKEQVHSSLQTYEKLFKETSGISWKEACNKALLHVSAIEKYNANYMKEMEGLAKGAAVQFEDILALNARSEIALSNAPDGCTSFALTKPKTSKTWLAQNWDWKGAQIDSLVHLEIQQDTLPTVQMITEAGIIGKIGCNSADVGVCLNALVTNTWQPKVPIHLGLRAILESESFEEAISKVDRNQMASPAHFLIASKPGDAASLEVSPIHTARIEATNGTLVHTNHLCSTEMRDFIREEVVPNSYSRFDTIRNQVKDLKEKALEAEDLFHFLSNHDNYPNSICSHVTNDTDEESTLTGMETVFSIVMNLTDNKLSWIKGKPCNRIK